MAKNKWYAVRVGRTTGIFDNWSDTQKSVKGYSGAEHKSFATREQAQQWLDEVKVRAVDVTVTSSAPDLTELWDNTACGQDDVPPWELPMTKDGELTAFEAALAPRDSEGQAAARRVLEKYDAGRIWKG